MSGEVIWSSTSCGECPDQSVNTTTWLSKLEAEGTNIAP
jgi:hypothetical protein